MAVSERWRSGFPGNRRLDHARDVMPLLLGSRSEARHRVTGPRIARGGIADCEYLLDNPSTAKVVADHDPAGAVSGGAKPSRSG